jgi:hypothetical protein
MNARSNQTCSTVSFRLTLAVLAVLAVGACGSSASKPAGTSPSAAPGVTEPAPSTEPAEPVPVKPGADPTVDNAVVLVGLSLAEAEAKAAELGWLVRATTVDGEPQTVTMDLRFNRVNVATANGTVTAIESIG